MDNYERAVKYRINKIEEEIKRDSHKRLKESINRKFRTTFIGSLSIFQEKFGKLWGDDLPFHQLSDRQRQFRKLWEETRTLILNNGNNQLRAAQAEISEYCVEWNRYRTNFKTKDGQ